MVEMIMTIGFTLGLIGFTALGEWIAVKKGWLENGDL
jgi:hypothetical protein